MVTLAETLLAKLPKSAMELYISKWLASYPSRREPSAIIDLATILDSMVALGLFLALLALSAEGIAQGPCETSLGSSSVDVLLTSTSTRVETVTLTDKIISQRISTVRRNTTTTTIRATFTKLAPVTTSPGASIATITVTST